MAQSRRRICSRPTTDVRGEVYGSRGSDTTTGRASGGFLWNDPKGIGWAVRLVPAAGPRGLTYCGFAVTWLGTGGVFDPIAQKRYENDLRSKLESMKRADASERRRQLEKQARRLWLSERGERLLWWVHQAVLAQRTSVVMLPDVLLGQAIAGSDRNSWSASWRQDVKEVLRSLTFLHAAELPFDSGNWQPCFGSLSATLLYARDLKHRDEDTCKEGCPLWGLPGVQHSHFLITVGNNFLGILEQYRRSEDQSGVRDYNFRDEPEGEAGKYLKAARKAGQVVPIYLPAKLWLSQVQIGAGSRRIQQALLAEVTRRKGPRDGRPDRAHVFIGNRVPDGRGITKIVCPALRPDGRYVAFGGNGFRAGLGYRLVGRSGHGWLGRCGYLFGRSEIAAIRMSSQLLDDLGRLVQPLELIVVALEPKTGLWLSLAQLQELAGQLHGLRRPNKAAREVWQRLGRLHLRIYTSDDYLLRWRSLFTVVAQPAGGERSDPRAGQNLRMLMRRAGVSQRDLARELGVTQPFVSQVLTGRRPWPQGLMEQAEEVVSGRHQPVH